MPHMAAARNGRLTAPGDVKRTTSIMNFDSYECLSFDCYGTLIDWETGLLQALRPIFARHGVEVEDRRLLESYGRAEAAIQSQKYRPYREVLRQVLVRLGDKFGFAPTIGEQNDLADSVRLWPPFPDSTEALRRLLIKYRLIVLSNIDDDLFQGSAEQLQVDFDLVFTAQQIGAYKPSRKNFEFLLNHAGVERSRLLHVAQSLFHDIAPAKALGLATVWVNRRAGKEGFGATVPAEAQPDVEVPDLKTLARLAVGETH
jgi:2-haloacid dehalogenase